MMDDTYAIVKPLNGGTERAQVAVTPLPSGAMILHAGVDLVGTRHELIRLSPDLVDLIVSIAAGPEALLARREQQAEFRKNSEKAENSESPPAPK